MLKLQFIFVCCSFLFNPVTLLNSIASSDDFSVFEFVLFGEYLGFSVDLGAFSFLFLCDFSCTLQVLG